MDKDVNGSPPYKLNSIFSTVTASALLQSQSKQKTIQSSTFQIARTKQTVRKSTGGKVLRKQLAKNCLDISFSDGRSEEAASFQARNCGFERDQEVLEEHKSF
ncbi:hypothetical protein Pint_31706 [Pistacia integerrima]|uniref:Uncharacterized protein n=1 Tax=Pistacia integerrima TaxID=434235 RepID=A0ACC0XRY3_9ROSI|nr:hypothetical protein Pint_31706 [Pistacia integerrima]